jgi:hypothetical protein
MQLQELYFKLILKLKVINTMKQNNNNNRLKDALNIKQSSDAIISKSKQRTEKLKANSPVGKKKKSLSNCTVRRKIDILMPGSFFQKLTVISTMISETHCETAIAHIESLNCIHALTKLPSAEWKILEHHLTPKDALEFHERVVGFDANNPLGEMVFQNIED